MARTLGLVERIIRDALRDEGGVIVVTGTVAVEADFPGCKLGSEVRKGDIWKKKVGVGREQERVLGRRTSRKRNHLVPFRRKVSLRPRLQDPFIKDLISSLRIRLLDFAADLLHAVGCHKIRIALECLIEVDFLESALGVVAAAEVLHLRENFDHGSEAEDGCFFGVEVNKALAEAGAVRKVVGGVLEIFFVAGGAVLERERRMISVYCARREA